VPTRQVFKFPERVKRAQPSAEATVLQPALRRHISKPPISNLFCEKLLEDFNG
jgi:hypothetical protein